MGIFRRSEVGATLGTAVVAQRAAAPCTVPRGCVGVALDRRGVAQRIGEGARLAAPKGGAAWCFHPGPYQVELAPFDAAPEAGIRLAYVVDSPDPRVGQQRFDLFLAGECGGRLDAAQLGGMIEAALRRELAQGKLDLPPCMTLDEWDTFRAGFDELLYMRFGLTVEQCAPADLHGARDYAAMLLARAATPQPATPSAAPEPPPQRPEDDARALRRLFLELPRIASALRAVALPPGIEPFRRQQALLQRLELVSLAAATLPALELAGPGRPLDARRQALRIGHALRAGASLDEAWALLARINAGAPLSETMEDAERIVANLEHDCAARRGVHGVAA